MKSFKILAINPGSTSTKIAIFEDDKRMLFENISHSEEEIGNKKIIEQYGMRKETIIGFLKRNNFNVETLSAVVGRGGSIPPVKSGAYSVNEIMIERLRDKPLIEHASNLGALIAYEIAKPLNIPSMIYDAVSVDEMDEIARVSGIPEITRESFCHALNMKSVSRKIAEKNNKSYFDMNIIIAHMGGGITLSAHKKGRMIDVISDDRGPFSPERSGVLPSGRLAEMCFSGKYEKKFILKRIRGNGGLKSYLNTHDARKVEDVILRGDKYAKLIYEAMAYQISKGIGELSTVLKGDIDVIILTGGLAYSKLLTDWIIDRVGFLSKVEIYPGEDELEALALGALRVLRGEEELHQYIEG